VNVHRRRGAIHVEINVRTALLVVSTIGAVWLVVHVFPILLVILVAMMIMGMLNPLVERLEHRGLRRGYAIATVFLGLFVAVALTCVLTIPRFIEQISEIAQRLPQMQARVADELATSKWGAPLADSLRQTKSTEWIAKIERLGLTYSSRILGTIAYTMTSLFLAMYLIIDRDRMRGAVFSVIPRAHHVQASRILIKLEEIVGGYMRGQVITSVLAAIFTFAVLMIARVPNALAIATFAGIADVLPYVGAFLVCGPAFLAALPRGTPVALGVLVAMGLYQEFESRFVVPRVYGKVLRLPAATVMIALLVGGQLLGILGALIALPIAAGLRMVVEELRVDLPGEDVRQSVQIRQDRQDAEEQREFTSRTAGAPATEAAAIAIEIAEARRDHDAARPDSKL
jgi:predicted PurR-regulated permease PerM